MASAPPEPHPIPGTASFDDGGPAPRVRPYRPPAEAADVASRRGEVLDTEDVRRARVDAAAHDTALAAERGAIEDGHEPAIAAELLHASRARLTTIVSELAVHRVQAVASLRVAQDREERVAQRVTHLRAAVDTGADKVVASAERHRNAASPAEPLVEPDLPRGGTTLTHPTVPYAVGLALAAFEAQFGSRVVQPIMGADGLAAFLGAATLVLVLTAAVDSAARACAEPLRRAGHVVTNAALALVAACTLGGVGWTVVDVGSARGTNIAYSDAHRQSSRPRGLSFGTPQDAKAAQEALRTPIAPARRPAAASNAPDEPDTQFVVPLTLTALMLTFLAALRCAMAEEWWHARRSARDAQEEAELRHAEAREAQREREAALEATLDAHEAARAELASAAVPLDHSDMALAVAARRESEMTASLLARFAAETARACGVRGVRPPSFELPDIPAADDLVRGLVDPERARATQPVVRTTAIAEHAPDRERAAAAALGGDSCGGPGDAPPRPRSLRSVVDAGDALLTDTGEAGPSTGGAGLPKSDRPPGWSTLGRRRTH